MIPLSTAQLLDSWERGRGAAALEQAVLFLEAAGLEPTGLTLADADRCLLRLRMEMFGGVLPAAARCNGCGQQIEFDVPAVALSEPAAVASEFDVEVQKYHLRIRPPQLGDARAAAATHDPERARSVLKDRCLLAAHRDEVSIPSSEVPEAVVADALERLAECDIVLDLACPVCGNTESQTFDAAGFVAREFDFAARTALAEVDVLARAYGWTEQAILAMTPSRRQLYVELASQ